MKKLFYRLKGFKWHLEVALKTFFLRMKYPLTDIQSYNWGKDDHKHICIAARLLNKNDFKEVCPYRGYIEDLESDDRCDYCRYQTIIDFNTSPKGSKNITLYIDKRARTTDGGE